MITREQVADLQPGDVVLLRGPGGLSVRGPLSTYGAGSLVVGPIVNTGAWTVRTSVGDPGGLFVDWELEVQVRAPRPLYVNHPRTESVVGDVIEMDGIGIFLRTSTERYAGVRPHGRCTPWVSLPHLAPDTGPLLTKRTLRLLVDGETGQVVQ